MTLPDLALWVALTASPPAAAADPWGVQVEAAAEAPLLFGARVGAEIPGRIRFAAGGGWVPGGWLRRAEELALGAESDPSDDGIRDDASLGLWRVRAGWRPFPRSGFYVEGGYAHAGFTGDVPAALLDDASSVDLPPGVDPGTRLQVTSTLHLLEGEVGWEMPVGKVGVVRLGVMYMATVNAVVGLAGEPESDPRVATALVPALDQVTADLETLLEDRVHLPLVALGVGFRF